MNKKKIPVIGLVFCGLIGLIALALLTLGVKFTLDMTSLLSNAVKDGYELQKGEAFEYLSNTFMQTQALLYIGGLSLLTLSVLLYTAMSVNSKLGANSAAVSVTEKSEKSAEPRDEDSDDDSDFNEWFEPAAPEKDEKSENADKSDKKEEKDGGDKGDKKKD